MSDPIPAIKSAYISLGAIERWMMFAREEYEKNQLAECLDHIIWSIDALTAAKAKIENYMKDAK